MNISNEDKKTIAQDTLKMLEVSMYRQLLAIGEDPESFDYSVVSQNLDEIDIDKYKSIADLTDRINKVKEVIENLS